MIPPSALTFPVGDPDLFNLVKQGFVTDLQFTGGPLAFHRVRSSACMISSRSVSWKQREPQPSTNRPVKIPPVQRTRKLQFADRSAQLHITKHNKFRARFFKLANVARPMIRRQVWNAFSLMAAQLC